MNTQKCPYTLADPASSLDLGLKKKNGSRFQRGGGRVRNLKALRECHQVRRKTTTNSKPYLALTSML
jgi:hypothetical protein